MPPNPRAFALTVGRAITVLLAVAACVTPAAIQEVPDVAVIQVPTGAETKPLLLRKVVLKIGRGEDIGSLRYGILCAPKEELVYRGGRASIGGDELTGVFIQELTAANYTVVGDPDAVFQDPDDLVAELLVAGLVTQLQADVCYPLLKLGNTVDAKGQAFMEVEWQVYSERDRRVVYRVTTRGRGEVLTAQPLGEETIYFNAFAQATRNLMADPGFHNLVAGVGPSPIASRPLPEAVKIRATPLHESVLAYHVNDVRLGVVTVLAGPGHGSGFFIDERGYLLTNEHVVGAARFVTVKLTTGREVLGEVIATNVKRDIAIVKTEEMGAGALPIERLAPGVGAQGPLASSLSRPTRSCERPLFNQCSDGTQGTYGERLLLPLAGHCT